MQAPVHIAVIVPAYNVASWLSDCLASLQGQTHANWSAVVVDDGSSDATACIAEAWDDPRVRVVRQPNAGAAAARNRGIAMVRDASAAWDGKRPATVRPALGTRTADAVLFLDADDWLAANALAMLARLLDASPWAVAACGGLRSGRRGRRGSFGPASSRGFATDPHPGAQPFRQWRPRAGAAGSHRGGRRVSSGADLWRGLGVLDPLGAAGRVRVIAVA